ncbi:hypothetical protein, partial [Nonomuraea candida]|uniref:hypothetical protein n=1 Tax=Nonomuraea candida TaxID=359159 RepID=UPI0005B789A2
ITAGKADISGMPAELRPLLKAAFQRNPAKRPKAAELAEQLARMLPGPASGGSSVGLPDEISTVPRPGEPAVIPGPPPLVTERPSYEVSTPPVTPKRLLDGPDTPVTPQPEQQYISLLPGQPDPWPTRRVPPEELRQIQREAGLYPPQSPPAGGNGPAIPAQGEADVPTRRVRSDSPEYRRLTQSPHLGPGAGAGANLGTAPSVGSGPNAGSGLNLSSGPNLGSGPSLGSGPNLAPGLAPGLNPGRPDVPDYGRPAAGADGHDYGRPNPVPVQPPPYIPAQPHFPPQPTKRDPYAPGAPQGRLLQRSKAYGVAGAMLLVLMIVAAVLAPVPVAVVAIPVAILLRAADLAQPQLAARRAAGAAALDVLRVLAYPAALAKSAGITLALVLYALILGLPVTLLLTVVAGMSSSYALAWGAAIALWTICAGPGVEGPGKQMRRTLASLVPSRTVAMVMAGVLAAGAALSLTLAYGTFGEQPEGEPVWTPLEIDAVVEQLDTLGGKSGG